MNSKRLQSQLLPPECPICLQEYSNKCFANRCLHEFCFKCLHGWSKVRSDCPMCQQPFSSIFCNVKSDREYDECKLSLLNEPRLLPNRAKTCAICLQEFENKCRNNGCQHEFCFGCLHKWSEVTAKCPLCKQPFTSIVHNVQTNGQFDEYKVPKLKADSQSKNMTCAGTLSEVYRKLERKQVYERNLWVKPLPDMNGRYRDTAPKFFRGNQDSMKRLVPWLRRELACLLIDSNTLPHVHGMILKVITKHHILSENFRVLGPQTPRLVYKSLYSRIFRVQPMPFQHDGLR
jgi:Ring finger domain